MFQAVESVAVTGQCLQAVETVVVTGQCFRLWELLTMVKKKKKLYWLPFGLFQTVATVIHGIALM